MARRKNDYLTEVPDDFLDCRVFGHRWDPIGDYMNGQHVHEVLQCDRCESYAIVQWAKTSGALSGRRRSKYTPGYLNNTGQSITKNEARQERIGRTKFKTTAQFERLMDQIDRERESYR